MPKHLIDRQRQIAPGHNNLEELKAWNKFDDCLFQDYIFDDINTEWHDSEDRVLTADKRYKRIGKPWSAIVFTILTIEEFDYIRNNLCTGEDSLVTIREYSRTDREWNYYNATMIFVEGTYELGEWKEVRYEFRRLTEI